MQALWAVQPLSESQVDGRCDECSLGSTVDEKYAAGLGWGGGDDRFLGHDAGQDCHRDAGFLVGYLVDEKTLPLRDDCLWYHGIHQGADEKYAARLGGGGGG